MRIKQISVKKLFGVFDHTIPLHQEERITIIHGPNGYGKTVLLRMIEGFFNEDYAILHNTPFDELRICLTDESYVRLVPDHSNPDIKVDVFFSERGSKEEPFRLQFGQEKKVRGLNIPQRLPLDPVWLVRLRDKVSVHLVRTDRLQQLPPAPPRSLPTFVENTFGKSDKQMVLTVETYTKELAENIQEIKARYAEFSQDLDRTFPARLLTAVAAAELTDEEIQQRWKALSEKREQLIAAGLLENGHDSAVEIPAKIDDAAKKNALSIYLHDTQEKLAVFDDLAARIDLFQRIIKQRFQFKNMVVGKEKGFAFFTPNDGPLSVARLSSGEQHELVLLYELLFKVAPDSLILIDEPELSLHVAWQSQFLKDLQAIIKLVPMDFLIATHSPDIISDRWDLTVELKGPQP